MDAISKELGHWNLILNKVPATLINLMLKKYFYVLVKNGHIVNVICKLLNVETDKIATLMNALNDMCHIPSC